MGREEREEMEREERSTVVYNARFKFPRCKLERKISIPAGLKAII